MIVGLGIDVVDVERFGRALRRHPLLADRLFTDAERDLPLASLAARFAAKEALAKALGAPAGPSWRECEVVTDPTGQPRIEVSGAVAAATRAHGVKHLHVSLSHDAGIASAVVVLEGDPSG